MTSNKSAEQFIADTQEATESLESQETECCYNLMRLEEDRESCLAANLISAL